MGTAWWIKRWLLSLCEANVFLVILLYRGKAAQYELWQKPHTQKSNNKTTLINTCSHVEVLLFNVVFGCGADGCWKKMTTWGAKLDTKWSCSTSGIKSVGAETFIIHKLHACIMQCDRSFPTLYMKQFQLKANMGCHRTEFYKVNQFHWWKKWILHVVPFSRTSSYLPKKNPKTCILNQICYFSLKDTKTKWKHLFLWWWYLNYLHILEITTLYEVTI